jgi:predicted dehydrogenase
VSTVRVAVIGVGHLGKIHARLVKQLPEANLVAVVDPVAPAREQLAAELQVAAHADHRPLLGAIDAAIIATPTQYHADVAVELLRSGVHVLVEKPITLHPHEANELITVAEAQRLVLQVGHVERFNPALLAAESHLSEPKFIEATRCGPYTCRSTDIGVVLDLMIHDIDVVLSLVRDELVDVQALGSSVFGPHEDWARATLTFAGGCVAQLASSRVTPQAQRAMQVYTREAFATLDFGSRKATLMRPNSAVLGGEVDVNSLSPEAKTQLKERVFQDYLPIQELAGPDINAILEEQRDFLQAIRTGSRVRVSGRDGRNAVAVADRILASIASHCWDGQTTKPAGIRIDDAQPTQRGPHWHRARQAAPIRRRAG